MTKETIYKCDKCGYKSLQFKDITNHEKIKVNPPIYRFGDAVFVYKAVVA